MLRSKKIILSISTLGILTTSIIVPIVFLSNKDSKEDNENKKKKIMKIKEKEDNENKIKEIILKIKDKDILIARNVSTQTQSEIQEAIKNQLKKENPTLTLNDLLKISTNLSSLTLGNRIEVTLTISVNSVSQDLKIHVEKAHLLNGSNVTDDNDTGTIFQDSFGNLWTTSYDQKLQVLKANSRDEGYVSAWTDDETANGLLKNSNIDDGGGMIFQDSFKNLWTAGVFTKLQVLKANSRGDGYVSAWTEDETASGLLNGSNIDDGDSGIIFQDSFKNLWAMGSRKKLQVLKANSRGDGYVSAWTNDWDSEELLKYSNVTNGEDGAIFQDSFGNLWAMGKSSKLQVLKVNSDNTGYDLSDGWHNEEFNEGLLKDSNIFRGYGGKIFQDSFKNLWVMGDQTKLQVLKVNSGKTGYVSAWVNDNDKNTGEELLRNSKIAFGYDGNIFEDKFKNLWAMGLGSSLQVLKVNSRDDGYVSNWIDNNYKNTGDKLLRNSKIISGAHGTIFQDSFGNLWVMGLNQKHQVLKANSRKDGYVNEGWTDDETTERLLNGLNPTDDGSNGIIFQDSLGNLWTMGSGTKLQVLKVNSDKTGYIDSWQN